MELDTSSQSNVVDCPGNFCFLWDESKKDCGCPFGSCVRLSKNQGDKDFYEPNEPLLEKEGLPWFYFMPNNENTIICLIKDPF